MKRALVIIITALAVLLVYPSTDLLAKSPKTSDTPSVSIIPSYFGQPQPPGQTGGTGDDDDDGDPGDADDLSGIKGKNTGQSMSDAFDFEKARLVVKVWWMFFFHRLF